MTLMFFGTALATYGVALVISSVLASNTARAIVGSALVALGITLACGSARADSITAEEIEVPAPEWSVFFVEEDPSTPGPLVEYTPPTEIESDGPPVTPPPPTTPPSGPPGPPTVVTTSVSWCWTPFVSCGGNDGGPPRFAPPSKPLTAPVPEPSAVLAFAIGLALLAWCGPKRKERR